MGDAVTDPVGSVARELADLRRQVRELQTAARAPFTSVEGGVTTWLDDDGNERVAIGTDERGAFIRVPNAEGSASAFEVRDGVGVFPLSTGSWEREYEWPMDAQGRTVTVLSGFQPAWRVTLSLVTAEVHYSFLPVISSGSPTAGELQFRVAAKGPRSSGAPAATAAIPFDPTVYPSPIEGSFTVPSAILADGYEDVVGELVVIYADFRRSAGTGGIAIAPTEPAWCV